MNASGQSVLSQTYGDPNNAFAPFSISANMSGGSRSWQCTYDQFGNVLAETTPKGTSTVYTYSYANFALGELVSKKLGAKAATTYAYQQPSGLLSSVTMPSPTGSGTATTSDLFDSIGNLAQETAPGNSTASTIVKSFSCTNDGSCSQPARIDRPLTMVDSLGHAIYYRYGDRGNCISVDCMMDRCKTAPDDGSDYNG